LLKARNKELSIVKLSALVRSTHNRDGAIVLDVLPGEMFRLNFVGSRMLELLKEGRTEIQIADELSKEFGAARDAVAIDLHEFLMHLQKHHLLEFRQTENPSA
jgi:hypothetical protein